MIGHLIAAFRSGRQDAQRDVWRPPSDSHLALHYRDGWKSERRRMAATGKLPQLQLGLQDERADRA